MIKNIVVCADDYTQNSAVSQGIIHLIAQKRLSATSCLVTTKHWLEHADWLKPYSGQIDIGLHFNLTWGKPLSNMPQLASSGQFPTLSKLILAAYADQVVEQEIYAELNQQLDQFANALGKLPDFIDGHQHVHALPIVRRALLRCYQERLQNKNIWIRNICPANLQQLLTGPAIIKKNILYFIGGSILKQSLIKSYVPHNTSFAGIYNFNTDKQYSQLFPLFTAALQTNGLIMCHPGLASDDITDPIAKVRIKEYDYFSSDSFVHDCQQQQISISRFSL